MQLFQCVLEILKRPKQTKASAQLLCSSLTQAKRGSAGKAVELKDCTYSEHALLHRHFLNVFGALLIIAQTCHMLHCQNMQRTCSSEHVSQLLASTPGACLISVVSLAGISACKSALAPKPFPGAPGPTCRFFLRRWRLLSLEVLLPGLQATLPLV